MTGGTHLDLSFCPEPARHMPPPATQAAQPNLRLSTAPHRQRFLPSEQHQVNSDLVPTSAVGEAYAHIFPYESFNLMQSECFDMLFNSEVNVVVTGALVAE